MPLRTIYQEVPLDQVTKFFAERFILPDGKSLFSHTAYVDPVKGKVLFRLNVNEEPGDVA